MVRLCLETRGLLTVYCLSRFLAECLLETTGDKLTSYERDLLGLLVEGWIAHGSLSRS